MLCSLRNTFCQSIQLDLYLTVPIKVVIWWNLFENSSTNFKLAPTIIVEMKKIYSSSSYNIISIILLHYINWELCRWFCCIPAALQFFTCNVLSPCLTDWNVPMLKNAKFTLNYRESLLDLWQVRSRIYESRINQYQK